MFKNYIYKYLNLSRKNNLYSGIKHFKRNNLFKEKVKTFISILDFQTNNSSKTLAINLTNANFHQSHTLLAQKQ